MRSLIAVLTLLCCTQAFADPRCLPFGPDASGFKLALAPTANVAQWAVNPGAYYVTSWWCKGKYNVNGWFYFGLASDLPPSWFTDIQKVPTASLSALIAAQGQYMNKALSPEAKAVGEAQLAATKPALPAWFVTKNSTYTTRPMYAITNGVRSTTALKTKATVGAACACNALAIEEGTVSYCPIAATTVDLTKVTRCTP
jgi:hypothetical protein